MTLEIQEATKADSTLQALTTAVYSNQWPSPNAPCYIDPSASQRELQAFAKIKHELTTNKQNKIILLVSRIVLSHSLHHEALQITNERHQERQEINAKEN